MAGTAGISTVPAALLVAAREWRLRQRRLPTAPAATAIRTPAVLDLRCASLRRARSRTGVDHGRGWIERGEFNEGPHALRPIPLRDVTFSWDLIFADALRAARSCLRAAVSRSADRAEDLRVFAGPAASRRISRCVRGYTRCASSSGAFLSRPKRRCHGWPSPSGSGGGWFETPSSALTREQPATGLWRRGGVARLQVGQLPAGLAAWWRRLRRGRWVQCRIRCSRWRPSVPFGRRPFGSRACW
jgi:hypothetical protein